MGWTNADNKFGPTDFVVGPVGTIGAGVNYTSIQQAISDAVAQTGPVDIYIRPGVYTENLVIPGNIYLIATSMSGDFGPPVAVDTHVRINGDHTVSGNSITYCQGILFGSTSINFSIEDSGGGVAKVDFQNCTFLADDRVFVLGGATGNGQIGLDNCIVQSVGRCIVIPTGSTGGFYKASNTTFSSGGDGCVYTDSPATEGTIDNCSFVAVGASPFLFDTNSAGALLHISYSSLTGPATASIIFQASANVFSYHNTFDPSGNSEYIIGPGNYSYCDDVIIGGKLSSGIDGAAVQTISGWRPWAESDSSGTTVVRGTCAFDSTQFSVVEGFVELNGGNSPPFSDVSGAVGALVSNGYYATAATTFTLDAAAVQGDLIIIYVDTAAAVDVTANAGQQIRVSGSVSASAGTATSTSIGDSLTLRYRLATTTWESVSVVGNWNVI